MMHSAFKTYLRIINMVIELYTDLPSDNFSLNNEIICNFALGSLRIIDLLLI